MPSRARVAHSPGALAPLEAERRQLTVLFCDLVNSTALAGRLDPEDYREVIRAYYQTCAAVIQQYDGYIAQYLGDGMLVYFGYPQAHEDDAQRAIHTGLAMLSALADLNRRLGPSYGIHLRARVGIHTGLVVVGDVGGGPQHGQLALGVAPNIAAKIQAMATPDHVVISAATYRLVQGYFVCQDLGERTLPGVSEPVWLYQVLHTSEARGRLEAASLRGLTPLVGREAEIVLLEERWAQVQQGIGQVVVLSGEAGIGKSRLVRALMERLAETSFTRLEYRCSPYHQYTALYPAVDLLQRSLQFDRTTPETEKITRLESLLHEHRLDPQEHLPLLASLLSLSPPANRYPPQQMSPQQQRQRTLDTLLMLTLALAKQQSVLFIVEDLHWIDPSTLEWLGLLIDQGPIIRILTLMTCRPSFQAPWGTRAHVTSLTLNRLLPQQVVQMTQTIVGADVLPATLLERIVAQTDGVPLFVEEVTKFVLASQRLHGHTEETSASAPSAITIPATLHDLLMARLDQMGAAKGTAQLAATIGREFGFALLQAVASIEEETLRQDLRRLVDAELLYQRGAGARATYVFKHALIQEAAYASLLKSTRQQVHKQIAQVLEARFPALVETQPELVAQHYTAAGCTEQAVVYWQRAGQHASDRSAHLEAISHCTTGIELLKSLPETPERTQHAVTLHIALGAALQMTEGYAVPEVEHAYTQAYVLCQQVGETPELVSVLLGLWRFYNVRSQLHMARELGETLLRLAQRADDPTLAVIAHHTLGATWFLLGTLPAARQHLKSGIALYTPAQRHAPVFRLGLDPGVACRAYTAWTLWLLGYPAQALIHLYDTLALARELSHPYSLAWAQCVAAFVSQLRRDMQAVHEHTEAAVALATEHGFPLLTAWGTIVRGWALALQGQGKEGMAQLRQGITVHRATGASVLVPYFCTVLADVCDYLDNPEDGLQNLAEVHTLVEQHDERWWEAEVCRLRGVLLLRQPGTPQVEAETWLQQALDVARRQKAKALELRTAVSLSRLWQKQGRRDAACQLLAEVYNWFTEGFDTVDLQEAKALLDELAG